MSGEHVNPKCLIDGHNWQSWFHQPTDRLTRVCARWNCTAREEISTSGVTR